MFISLTHASHLAHFLLTINLLPVLNRTAEEHDSDVRVINVYAPSLHNPLPASSLTNHTYKVSSSAHTVLIPSTMRFDKPSDFTYHGTSSSPPYAGSRDLFSRYALSKLANILFTTALQKRHPNMVIASCSPSSTNTAGGMSVFPSFLRPIMSRLFVAPAIGARSVMLLAAGKEVAAEKDTYRAAFVGNNCKLETPLLIARDAEVAENLWNLSKQALAKWING